MDLGPLGTVGFGLEAADGRQGMGPKVVWLEPQRRVEMPQGRCPLAPAELLEAGEEVVERRGRGEPLRFAASFLGTHVVTLARQAVGEPTLGGPGGGVQPRGRGESSQTLFGSVLEPCQDQEQHVTPLLNVTPLDLGE